MSDDLRERIARAIAATRPEDGVVDGYLTQADAVLAVLRKDTDE